MLKVFIDGACEPCNPGGTAAFGLVVYRDDKRVLPKGKVIGEGVAYSNNVAEYAGLLEFLRLWQGIEDTVVYSDSLMLTLAAPTEAHNNFHIDYLWSGGDRIKPSW